ncbi:complement factor H [Polymixia lowei]
MHIITQSYVIFMWMYTLTLVKGQDCTLQDFLTGSLYDSNFDTTGLAATYPAGRQVRVGCNVGFTGFFKLVCAGGIWQSRGDKCTPRSCGHPGDTPFAEFHLEKGDDFVFGSEVVYTCHTGYQMVSRNNHRRCMAGGWDGVVPICAAQQCPVVRLESNVQVIGDPEDATYGNVLRFSCKSSSLILDGVTEIHCNENGDWSGEAPRCIEIKCTAPRIENGDVLGNIKEYKEGHILHFQCNENYKPTQSIRPRCTKTGFRAEWNPTPLCELVKCTLTVPPLTGTSYVAEDRSVFFPGDTVTVTCDEEFWIVDRQYRTKEITCQNDGEWNSPHVCKEVLCEVPHDSGVEFYRTYYRDWHRKRLNETVSYHCKRGYKTTDGKNRATCARSGWTPNPLCQEITCSRPHSYDLINNQWNTDWNGRAGTRKQFTCRSGYKNKDGRTHATCTADGWMPNPLCEVIEITCTRPRGSNLINNQWDSDWNGRVGATQQFTCRSGYKNKDGRTHATCTTDGWMPNPLCEVIEITCSRPHSYDLINNQWNTDWNGRSGTRKQFTCRSGYKNKDGRTHATCTADGWMPNPLCEVIEITCSRPHSYDLINNPRYNDWNRRLGTTQQFTCKSGYKNKDGRTHATCTTDGWMPNPLCEDSCSKPQVENGFAVGPYNGTFYYSCNEEYKLFTKGWWGEATCTDGVLPGHLRCIDKSKCGEIPEIPHAEMAKHLSEGFEERQTINIHCKEGFSPSIDQITCLNGKWDLNGMEPAMICRPIASSCNPPLRIENAVVTNPYQKKYLSEAEVTYQCRDNYTMEGQDTIRCKDGEWEQKNLRCIQLCEKPKDAEQTITVKDKRAIYMNGDVIEYQCIESEGKSGGNATCVNGTWSKPIECKGQQTVVEEE